MIFTTIRMALREVRRNALRSFLTMLGVVIGVASVVALVSLGQSATEKVSSDIAKLGQNLLLVRTGTSRRPCGESNRQVPSSAAPSAIIGPAGSPAHRLPPTVATFQILKEARNAWQQRSAMS